MAKVIHTCTGCVPIDASIVEVYTRLIATEARAEAAAEHAEAATGKAPYIGENGNWWEWDSELEQFVDTNVPASGGGSDPNAVKYTEQSLTDPQRAQARENIGAGTSSFSGNYNDLSGKPTIPTDTVNYTSQTLTSEQQAQARANIGAAPGTAVAYLGDVIDTV